jgi:REP element-mobilizing transposase RayT
MDGFSSLVTILNKPIRLLEVNASQKDKDFIMAVNWKKAEEYLKAGKGVKQKVKYAHNVWDEQYAYSYFYYRKRSDCFGCF